MQEEFRVLARAEMEKKIRMRIELQQAERDDMDNKRRIREREVAEEDVRFITSIHYRVSISNVLSDFIFDDYSAVMTN